MEHNIRTWKSNKTACAKWLGGEMESTTDWNYVDCSDCIAVFIARKTKKKT